MLKKLFSSSFLLIILLGVFLIPATKPLFAENQYTPLAPIPGITDQLCTAKSVADRAKDPKCNVSAGKYIPQLVVLAIQIAGGLAVLMIVVGGIQYATADAISGKEDGKKKIVSAIEGLLLAIGAYVIMYTINPATLTLTLNIPSYYGKAIPSNPTATSTPPVPGGPAADLSGQCWPGPNPSSPSVNCLPGGWPGGVGVLDAAVRADLINYKTGVPVKIVGTGGNADCIVVGQGGCTSLDGLSSAAINGIKRLIDACQFDPKCGPLGITITGGTEFWAHGNGKADVVINTTWHRPGEGTGAGAVDISKSNSFLNDVIMGNPGQKNLVNVAGCSTGNHYYFNGKIYVDEVIAGNAPHWHVCY